MNRGYFGIGIWQPKSEVNVGGLWRSAQAFGADFIFTVGHRYYRQPADTTACLRHIPLFEYKDLLDMTHHMPRDSQLVPVETNGKCELPRAVHPERAVYLLGAEDYGLPEDLMERCSLSLKIDTQRCLNVATTGSIVLYDRMAKAKS